MNCLFYSSLKNEKKDKNLPQISWEDSFDHYSYVDTVNINELEKQQENLMFSLITGCCFFLKKRQYRCYQHFDPTL